MAGDRPTLELNQPERVSPDVLQLDRLNPRLVLAGGKKPTDKQIINLLYQEDELSELLSSIAANGYLDFEPLVVLDEGSDEAYTVLEGNRRLAAVRLIKDLELAAELGITIPNMPADLIPTMDAIRVILVESRAAARTFIAFKHINGPHRWNSYAKAQYAARWYRDEKENNPDATLDAIAERIGDKHTTIKRMVAAIYVLEQAEKEGLFTVDNRTTKRFPFSHLYVALSRREYTVYLGLGTSWAKWEPIPNPVPADHLEKLKDVLHWIFGFKPDGIDSIIGSQNPDIKRLGEVIGSTAAVATLRAESSLKAAWEQTRPADTKFSTALIAARGSIRDAVNSVHAFDGKDLSLLEVSSEIKEQADLLHERMVKKTGESS